MPVQRRRENKRENRRENRTPREVFPLACLTRTVVKVSASGASAKIADGTPLHLRHVAETAPTD